MKDKSLFWVILFWLGMLIILVWFFLKAIGVINTPAYIEYLPMVGWIFSMGAFFQMFLDFRTRLARLERRTDNIAEGLQRLEFKFDGLESKFEEHVERYHNK